MENYLVFDIGGTAVKYGILNSKGEILNKGNFVTPKNNINELYYEIKDIYEKYGKIFSGIALSCPGAVNSEKGIIAGVSAIPYIHGPNIKKDLEEMFDLEVSMENDANCAALAEVWLGEAKENEDVAFIVLGSGVGGALIKERLLHKGRNLQAGEFGIMYFQKEDGTHGLWGEISPVRFAMRISKLLGKEVDGKELFRLADEEKNTIVIKEIENWYKDIAKGLLTIQYVYDPEKIIIGGAISQREDLIENIDKALKEFIINFPEATIIPKIKKCKFENDANLIGALYNLLSKKNKV